MTKNLAKILLFISIITGCNPPLSDLPVTLEENTSSDASETPQTPDKVVIVPKNCAELQNYEKDTCIYNFVRQKIYDPKQTDETDSLLCGLITKNSWKNAECYWLFAMKFKDQNLCEFLPEQKSNITEYLEHEDYPPDYALINNCHETIAYENGEANWQLSSGIPPYADPEPLVFEGRAELQGWIVNIPFYVGESEPHFHVADESLKNIPQQFGRDFYLQDLPAETLNQLMQHGENNPATAVVTEIKVLIEGNPIMQLQGILE